MFWSRHHDYYFVNGQYAMHYHLERHLSRRPSLQNQQAHRLWQFGAWDGALFPYLFHEMALRTSLTFGHLYMCLTNYISSQFMVWAWKETSLRRIWLGFVGRQRFVIHSKHDSMQIVWHCQPSTSFWTIFAGLLLTSCMCHRCLYEETW